MRARRRRAVPSTAAASAEAARLRRKWYINDSVFAVVLYLFAFTARDVLFHIAHARFCTQENNIPCRTWCYIAELILYLALAVLIWVYLIDTRRHWFWH